MKLNEKYVFEIGEHPRFTREAQPKLSVLKLAGDHLSVTLDSVFDGAIQGITVDGEPVTYDAMYAKLQEFRREQSTIVLTLSGALVEVEKSF